MFHCIVLYYERFNLNVCYINYAVVWSADPYVKIWLIQYDRRIEKKKTAVLKRTLNPQFDETLVFNVSIDQVRYTTLQLQVMDYDLIGCNEEIGRVVLGSKSGSNEVKHWNEMLAKTKSSVTSWHVLKGRDWYTLMLAGTSLVGEGEHRAITPPRLKPTKCQIDYAPISRVLVIGLMLERIIGLRA